jgi:hypothetical protein
MQRWSRGPMGTQERQEHHRRAAAVAARAGKCVTGPLPRRATTAIAAEVWQQPAETRKAPAGASLGVLPGPSFGLGRAL